MIGRIAMLPDATPSGVLLVLALVLPLAGILVAFVAGGRHVERVALATLPLGLVVVLAVAVVMLQTGRPLVYLIGSWAPPLGVALRADGLSAAMMIVTAVVICAVGLFARADSSLSAGTGETRAPFVFWILLLAIWTALNTIFSGGDLFSLFVALEMLTFAAVPLVSLDGRGETLRAALRYLLFALLGSALYLLGTALLYGAYGTLDIALLSRRVEGDATTLVAAALMTVGLLAKTALFPLYLWLPPAHAGAPAAASAVLSGLVVKGSFFIVVRLWLDVMPGLAGPLFPQLLAALGTAAIVVGSIVALRQERLKLLVAYSTLAQIGYLFLMFPLALDPAAAGWSGGGAVAGGVLQAMAHATAKAAMFMAAGTIYAALGHDRISALGGVARVLPMSVLAFALGGVALIGLPPSGAYLAKELLLDAAGETGQWWWAVVLQAGGIFTSGYLWLVLLHAVGRAEHPVAVRDADPSGHVSRVQQVAALMLALCSLLLGLPHWGALLPFPSAAPSISFSGATLLSAVWTVLGGGALALLVARWGKEPAGTLLGRVLNAVAPARRAGLAGAGLLAQLDQWLRRWPAAVCSLVTLAVLLATCLLAGR
ncbi:MAG: NADH-quinone oxidoreductase subunit J [Hyphomicrobiales bacterium]|nr:NADH-quinone oxidoreductase subunit J [Hyphomicrobiales bacterium]